MFSAVDGFRSSVVNVANGYFATFSSTSLYTGIPSTDGSVTVLAGTDSSTEANIIAVKLNNTNSARITFAKELGNVTNTQTGLLGTVDGGGNIYLVGSATVTGSPTNASISKLDSNGSLLWQKDLLPTTYGGAVAIYGNVDVEAGGGNVYASGYSTVLISGNLEAITTFVKYNSNGNIVSQRRSSYINAGGSFGVLDGRIRDITVDSGNNVYITGQVPQSLDGNVTYKFGGQVQKINSSGTVQWNSGLYDITNTGNVIFDQSVVDSSGNVYTIAQTTVSPYDPILMKFHSNGVISWQKDVDNVILQSLSVDNTGNLYVAGRLSSNLAYSWYASFNENTGNINWQNFIYSSSGNMVINDINYANSFLYGGGVFQTGSNTGFAMKLPSDGSGSGTHGPFVISSGNITIATNTLSSGGDNFGFTSTSLSNTNGSLTLTNSTTTRKIIPL